MSLSSRFAVATHVLSLLAIDRKGWVPSDALATSVNTNPVVIRRLLGMLRRAGLVEGQTGPAGGSRLSRNASAITLREIYEAVEERSVLTLHDSPNQKCPVGKRIESVLTHVRDEADLAMKKELERTTLASIVDQLDCIDWR